MALTFDRVLVEANAFVGLANRVTTLLADVQQVLTHNSNQAIDWGAGQKPAYITEDAAGNLQGLTFSRQDVANAIGSLDAVRKLLTNLDLTGLQGDHVGNMNKLANPLG